MLHCDDVCIDDDHYLSYMQWVGGASWSIHEYSIILLHFDIQFIRDLVVNARARNQYHHNFLLLIRIYMGHVLYRYRSI